VLSVIHITNRGLYPLVGDSLRHVSQYELLSECLREQTFDDYELICVDQYNPLPRRELAWLGDRVRLMRPKPSPWHDLGAFAPSIARNTGLLSARGDIVFSIDDCTSFGPTLLEQIAHSAMAGEYVVPVYIKATGERWGWKDRTHCGGIISYPRAEALAAGGWEERFAGCYALEDWEFSGRLARRGVKFVQSDEAKATLEKHTPRKADYLRCPWAVSALLDGQEVANGKWTTAQLSVFTAAECTFKQGDYCLAREKAGCPCPERPSHRAVSAMLECES